MDDTLLGRTFCFDGIAFTVIGFDPSKGLRLWNAQHGATWCGWWMWSAMRMQGLEAA